MEQTNDPSILRSKVEEIEKEVKDLEKEKENLQSICSHKESYVAFNESKNTRLYCKQCKKDIGWPTQAQQDEFLK